MYVYQDMDGATWIDLLGEAAPPIPDDEPIEEIGLEPAPMTSVEPVKVPTSSSSPTIIVVNTGTDSAAVEKTTESAAPWYREPTFVGAVIGVVVLTVLGLYMAKAEKLAGG